MFLNKQLFENQKELKRMIQKICPHEYNEVHENTGVETYIICQNCKKIRSKSELTQGQRLLVEEWK